MCFFIVEKNIKIYTILIYLKGREIMKEKGLTKGEVERLTKEGKTNYIKNKADKSYAEIVFSNVFTYFNGIFTLLAVLLIIGGAFKGLVFLPVVVINIIIGIFQQFRSKRVLDKLALLDESKYIVVRDGIEEEVKSTSLVLGDIIKLDSGKQIPADGTVIYGNASVNESLLTGESDEIEKTEGSELKSGSFIVSGVVYARLTHVGSESYVSKITSEAKKIKEKKSEMISEIEKYVRISGIVIIPIGGILLYQSMVVNGEPYSNAISSMVAAVTGMIPEGLYLLVTIALALSAARLAKKKVLLHDMKSIEALARVDILCVDKTGTITSTEMDVTDVFGRVDEKDKELEEAKEILSKYINTIPDNNATMIAMRKYFPDNGLLESKEILPFDSKNKYSCIKTSKRTYKLGAPEFLIDKKDMSKNQELIEKYTGEGKRVLALVENDKPIIFIALQNELRENAKETFSYFEEQGITIKVISGDNPLTVSKIAEKANIYNADKYVDASTLDTEEKIKEAILKYTVFGRVKPEQKKQIVDAIKANNLKVAMTGDGVNDILAMKEADCSIAMGEGSEAARSAAQVVLLDSDFSHMKDIVFEGRRNINNITRSATLFLYKNIFSFLLAVFSIGAAFSYPLKPTQISILSFFNIGLPAFLLTFEPNTKKQEGSFAKNVFTNAIPAALTSFFFFFSMMVFAEMFGISQTEVSTASIYLISVVGFNILWFITRPLNNYHRIIFAICILGMLGSSRLLGQIFDMHEISAKATALCLVFAFAEMNVIKDVAYTIDQIDKRILKVLREKQPEKFKKVTI